MRIFTFNLIVAQANAGYEFVNGTAEVSLTLSWVSKAGKTFVVLLLSRKRITRRTLVCGHRTGSKTYGGVPLSKTDKQFLL